MNAEHLYVGTPRRQDWNVGPVIGIIDKGPKVYIVRARQMPQQME
jgi:hypothetical protein